MIRDRDTIYGEAFNATMRGLGLRQMVTAYHSPSQNAYAERVIGTFRRECLDHLIVVGEEHARRVIDEYVRQYDEERTHQALDGDSPLSRADERSSNGTVIASPHLGGLHHSNRRAT